MLRMLRGFDRSRLSFDYGLLVLNAPPFILLLLVSTFCALARTNRQCVKLDHFIKAPIGAACVEFALSLLVVKRGFQLFLGQGTRTQTSQLVHAIKNLSPLVGGSGLDWSTSSTAN